jgi:hypothetical protein
LGCKLGPRLVPPRAAVWLCAVGGSVFATGSGPGGRGREAREVRAGRHGDGSPKCPKLAQLGARCVPAGLGGELISEQAHRMGDRVRACRRLAAGLDRRPLTAEAC